MPDIRKSPIRDVNQQPASARFGAFEANFTLGVLRKHGIPIKLHDQPFQVLATLLSRPGELITREEIQQKLWPSDTFVDFDNGLNRAVNRLRDALGDSAEQPKFIETIPRRGYRFLAPVDFIVNGHGAEEAQAESSKARPAVQARSHAWLRWMAAAAGVLAIAGIGLFLLRPLLPPPRILSYTQLTHDGRIKWFVLTTDGARVYFAEQLEDKKTWILASVSTLGGETVPLPTSVKTPLLEDISPDGTQLLVSDGSGTGDFRPFHVVKAVDGSTRRLGEVEGQCGGWLADGRIIYAKDRDIGLVNRDGSRAHTIVTLGSGAIWPRSSPDGKLIRFTSDGGLWEIKANGASLRPLLPGWEHADSAGQGSWIQNGKYFVFTTQQNGGGIWAVREEWDLFRKVNHKPVQLAMGPIYFGYPISSPNGKRLFVRGRLARAELKRYNPKSRTFAPYLRGISAWWLNFSSSRDRLTYLSYPENTLWSSKLDGSKRIQLTFPPLEAAAPRVSPDGKQIAFMAKRLGAGYWNIHLVPTDGGTPEALLPADHDESFPDWSSDGKRLVFGNNLQSDSRDLETLDLQTRELSRIPGSAGLEHPRWSPNGQYLIAKDSKHHALQLYSFAARTWSELVKLDAMTPLWSPDSNSVYFSAVDQGKLSVHQVNVSNRIVDRLLGLENLDLAGDLDLDWSFSLAPDNSLILPLDVGVLEIYALDWDAP